MLSDGDVKAYLSVVDSACMIVGRSLGMMFFSGNGMPVYGDCSIQVQLDCFCKQ